MECEWGFLRGMVTLNLKKLALALFLALSVKVSHADQLSLSDFSCGLQTTEDASLIGDGCATDLKNTDQRDGSISTRPGSIKQNGSAIDSSNQPVRFLHQYVDAGNNFWLLEITSNSLYASSNGGVTNTLITSTHGITSSSDFSAVNAFGKVRLTDGATNWILWDGLNVSVSTASPHGKPALYSYERIWTAVGSTLYASAFGSPEDWTDDGLADDDSFSEPIRNADGYSIRAVIEWRGDIYIFKDYSLDRLSTTDGITFSRTPVSNTIGTKQAKSIQVTPTEILFLGPDNFYSYNGVTLAPISKDISDTVSSINQLLTTEQAQVLTTQVDFTGGQSTYTTITQVSGSVLAQNYSQIDGAAGSSSFADGTREAGLLVAGDSLFAQSAISQSLVSGTTVTLFADSPSSRHFAFGINSGYSSEFLLADWLGGVSGVFGEKLYYVSNPISTGSWDTTYVAQKNSDTYFDSVIVLKISTAIPTDFSSAGYSLELQGFTASSATVKLIKSGAVVLSSATISRDFFGAGGDHIDLGLKRTADGVLTVYADGVLIMTVTDTTYSSFPYLVFGYNGTRITNTPTSNVVLGWALGYLPLSATYVSGDFDLAQSNIKRMKLTPTYALSVGSVTYSVYNDSDAIMSTSTVGSFISSQTLSGSSPFLFDTPAVSHLRYSARFEDLTAGISNTVIEQVDLEGVASTGTYLTPPVNVSSMSYWSAVGITQTEYFTGGGSDSGTIAYTVYSDSNTSIDLTNPASYTASQSIVNGQVPAISTGAYVRLGASYTVAAATTARKGLDLVTFNYGSGASFPTPSIYYNNEYFCGVSISSPTINDAILVFDLNRKFTLYDNWQAYSLTQYRQKPYVGRSLSSDIWRVLVPNLYTDNNGAYTSSWTSKEFNFGYPATDKKMNRYYVTGEYRPNQDVSFQYGVNRSTQTTSLAISQGLTQGSFKRIINPVSTTYSLGGTHKFKFINSDSGESFKILSVTLDPRLEAQP